jgi:hypothetical protein
MDWTQTPNGDPLWAERNFVYLYSKAEMVRMFAQPNPDAPLLELPLFLSR